MKLIRRIGELVDSVTAVTCPRTLAAEELNTCQGSGRSPVRWPLIFLVGGQQNSMLVVR
jgi:hypothetical protein